MSIDLTLLRSARQRMRETCHFPLTCGHSCGARLVSHTGSCPPCLRSTSVRIMDGSWIVERCNGVGFLDASLPVFLSVAPPSTDSSDWSFEVPDNFRLNINVVDESSRRTIPDMHILSPFSMKKCAGHLPCGHRCQSFVPVPADCRLLDECHNWQKCSHVICEIRSRGGNNNQGANCIYAEKAVSLIIMGLCCILAAQLAIGLVNMVHTSSK